MLREAGFSALDDDFRECLRLAFLSCGEVGGGAQRDGAVAAGDVAVGFGGGGRVAVIGFFADADVERHVAEVGHVVADGEQFAAVFAEDMATLSNMVLAFFASSRAMSCGVVMMTAPATGICWERVSWVSPVPGGRSMMR